MLLALLTVRDAGISADEPACAEYGRQVANWFATLGRDAHALHSWDWHYYGGAYEGLVAVAERLSPASPIDTRHLLNAVVGIIGAWGCATLGRLVAGPAAGFWAAALLLVHPSWWGHLFANSKDIPFAAAHTWAIVGLVRLAQAPPDQRIRRSVISGGLIGLALAVRAGGMFLFAELAAVLIATGWPERRPSFRALFSTIRFPLLAAIITAWLVMIAGWPYGLTHPVAGPISSAMRSAHFPNEVSFLWFGETLTSTHLPWYYLPVSLIIRSPLLWTMLAPAGLWILVRRPSAGSGLTRAVLAISLLVPTGLIVLTGAALYNGIRHVLFLLPLMSVIVALPLAFAWEKLQRRPAGPRWIGRLAVLMLPGLHIPQVISLHPYAYMYLNGIAGNTWSSASRFEVDDYGLAMREAWKMLAAHHRAGRNASRPGRVLVPESGAALGVDDLPELRRTASRRDADYLLLKPPRSGNPATARGYLFSVSRQGVPLMSAYALRGRSDKILPVIPR